MNNNMQIIGALIRKSIPHVLLIAGIILLFAQPTEYSSTWLRDLLLSKAGAVVCFILLALMERGRFSESADDNPVQS